MHTLTRYVLCVLHCHVWLLPLVRARSIPGGGWLLRLLRLLRMRLRLWCPMHYDLVEVTLLCCANMHISH